VLAFSPVSVQYTFFINAVKTTGNDEGQGIVLGQYMERLPEGAVSSLYERVQMSSEDVWGNRSNIE